MGYPMYDLTSIVHQYGFDGCIDAAQQRKQVYLDKLLYWNEHLHEYTETWADFMLRQEAMHLWKRKRYSQ